MRKRWLFDLVLFGWTVNAIHPIVPPTAPIAEIAEDAVQLAVDLPKMILPKHKGTAHLNSIFRESDVSAVEDQSTRKGQLQKNLGNQAPSTGNGPKEPIIQNPPTRHRAFKNNPDRYSQNFASIKTKGTANSLAKDRVESTLKQLDLSSRMETFTDAQWKMTGQYLHMDLEHNLENRKKVQEYFKEAESVCSKSARHFKRMKTDQVPDGCNPINHLAQGIAEIIQGLDRVEIATVQESHQAPIQQLPVNLDSEIRHLTRQEVLNMINALLQPDTALPDTFASNHYAQASRSRAQVSNSRSGVIHEPSETFYETIDRILEKIESLYETGMRIIHEKQLEPESEIELEMYQDFKEKVLDFEKSRDIILRKLIRELGMTEQEFIDSFNNLQGRADKPIDHPSGATDHGEVTTGIGKMIENSSGEQRSTLYSFVGNGHKDDLRSYTDHKGVETRTGETRNQPFDTQSSN